MIEVLLLLLLVVVVVVVGQQEEEEEEAAGWLGAAQPASSRALLLGGRERAGASEPQRCRDLTVTWALAWLAVKTLITNNMTSSSSQDH